MGHHGIFILFARWSFFEELRRGVTATCHQGPMIAWTKYSMIQSTSNYTCALVNTPKRGELTSTDCRGLGHYGPAILNMLVCTVTTTSFFLLDRKCLPNVEYE